MTDNTYKINSKIDIETFTDFSYFHNFVLGNKKIGFIVSSIVLVILAIINLFTGSKPLFFIFIAIALGVPAMYYYFYQRTLKNQININQLSIPKEAYTLIINKEGVNASNQSEHATYPWRRIFRIYRTSKYIYIYIIKNKAFILPYKDLVDTTPDKLWNYITAHTKNTRYFKTV